MHVVLKTEERASLFASDLMIMQHFYGQYLEETIPTTGPPYALGWQGSKMSIEVFLENTKSHYSIFKYCCSLDRTLKFSENNNEFAY